MRKAALSLLIALSLGRAEATPAKHGPEIETAKIVASKFVYEAFPSWAAAHPDKACPAKIDELYEYLAEPTKDPWGHPYRLFCGATLPKSVKIIGISSDGPDGKPSTVDDIKSWE